MLKEQFRVFQKNRIFQKQLYSYKQNYKILKECLFLINKLKARKILLFCPLKYEPDLIRFRRKLNTKCKLFVPFMQDKSLKIVKFRLPLTKKRFGVYESNNSFVQTDIDLAIVPVIGVDKNFKRIGHGQGFYDRFFSELKTKPKIIFVQNINAISQKILSFEHDIQGNFYITPQKKYYKKDRKNDCNICVYSRHTRLRNRIFSCEKNQRRQT